MKLYCKSCKTLLTGKLVSLRYCARCNEVYEKVFNFAQELDPNFNTADFELTICGASANTPALDWRRSVRAAS